MTVGAERVPRVPLDSDHVPGFDRLPDRYFARCHVAHEDLHTVRPVNSDVVAPLPRGVRLVRDNRRGPNHTVTWRDDSFISAAEVNSLVIVLFAVQRSPAEAARQGHAAGAVGQNKFSQAVTPAQVRLSGGSPL